MAPQPTPTYRILREPEVVELTGLSRMTLRRNEAAGTFHRRFRIGENAVGWLESEVDAWIRERDAEREPAA